MNFSCLTKEIKPCQEPLNRKKKRFDFCQSILQTSRISGQSLFLNEIKITTTRTTTRNRNRKRLTRVIGETKKERVLSKGMFGTLNLSVVTRSLNTTGLSRLSELVRRRYEIRCPFTNKLAYNNVSPFCLNRNMKPRCHWKVFHQYGFLYVFRLTVFCENDLPQFAIDHTETGLNIFEYDYRREMSFFFHFIVPL